MIYVNVFSENRAKLNTDRIKRIDDKTLVYVISVPMEGAGLDEFPFQYDGIVKDVTVSCQTVGSTDTYVNIQRCTPTDYASEPVWENVFSSDLLLGSGKRISDKNTNTAISQVNKGDVFRTYIRTLGSGIMNMTIQFTIQINIEG